MQTIILDNDPSKWQAAILLGFGFEDEDFLKLNPEVDAVCPWLAVAPAMRDFTGKAGQEIMFYGHPDLNVPRTLLLGGGKREDMTLDKLRTLVAKGLRKCRSLGMASIVLPMSVLDNLPGGFLRCVEEAAYAAHVGLYRFLELRKPAENEEKDPESLIFAGSDKIRMANIGKYVSRGETAAKAVKLARDLDNLPANLLYPEILALRAVALAQDAGFDCEILAVPELEKEKMNCMLAVGKGSSHPPRLVILEYKPEGHEQDKPLVLIGKGLTFDSGGICLKPAANMWQMKCDMSGAAAVLAAIDAACREKSPRRVVGVLACAENMPDGKAFRPGDVLESAKGDNVEVINTDAEGRLVLCDAIAYAQKRWQPEALVDIATLTGACAVALGNQVAGLFATDDGLAKNIGDAGALCGENLWRMPLWEGYVEELKSPIADIRHTASREGGAITAALFLKHFVEEKLPWAHLDIAGVDFNSKNQPLCPEGATGFGTRILLELCREGR